MWQDANIFELTSKTLRLATTEHLLSDRKLWAKDWDFEFQKRGAICTLKSKVDSLRKDSRYDVYNRTNMIFASIFAGSEEILWKKTLIRSD